jgi:hypothetical protein
MNIARRMNDGELFSFAGQYGEAPWISRADVRGLEELDFRIQEDHGFHEAHFAYSLDKDEFKKRYEELVDE